MKLLYDYQIFTKSKYGGISRYFCELSSRISRNENFDVNILAPLYINQYLREYNNSVLGLQVPAIPKTSVIRRYLNHKLSKAWLSSNLPDILHETYYSPYKIVPDCTKTVVTVYDMLHERLEHLYPELKTPLIQAKFKAVQRADRIICISENTRKDLLEIFNIEPQKVKVIHLGCSFKVQHSKKPYFDFPYILYVGYRKSYKNFHRLLQAYSISRILKQNFKLICCGEQPFSKEELQMIQELGIPTDRVLHILANDNLLHNLYYHAGAFIYPSLYEGFGLPILEAMSSQCPVICSNVSSIPEVADNAAEFFDPYNPESIAHAIEKVLFSNERRESLVKLGLNRIKCFSWEKCTEQTALVYSSLFS